MQSPVPVEPFDILFDKQITGLHLDKGQVGDGLYRMSDTFIDCNRITSADNRHDTVEYQHTLTVYECPYFIAMAVYLIADTLAGFDFQLLGKGFVTVGELNCIDHLVFAPATRENARVKTL